ncbi:winged helix-turn-helix transcriptional regulator, partial [Streptomyces alboverticillatus]|uniref:winged helix-turn-helix transcriptional regulator n=1 Tax=Streptomyces alboverticillatus TaxID=173770 RepID=UPI003CCC24A2
AAGAEGAERLVEGDAERGEGVADAAYRSLEGLVPEDDGVVLREEAFEGAVRRVSYALTPLGVSLNEALGPLGAWGRKHLLGGRSGHDEALDRS